MKKVLSVTGFLLWMTISLKAQSIKFSDIIGNWEIVGENGAAGLQIIDSNTIILTYMGETKKLTDYKMDFSKSPCWFDFSTKDSSSVIHVKSILRKEGDDLLKWQLFVDEDRAAHFTTGKGELFYLRRAKQSTGVAVSTH